MRGEQRLLDGLARPKVKMVSWRRRIVSASPFIAAVFIVRVSKLIVLSLNDTSFSFISFSMSIASA